ncbi:MAG: small subunit ribosomal protein, partial [Solirubrobacteraceae bacterium]|nr:small subunit ribosomal protein [Solirubrobacteraceae bacterium]
VDTYNVGDELEGTVTKVVTFGAFVEILDGVEGLVHISELANHHVENPREVVQPGDEVKVKVLEIDSERRRLSLSVKRVEGQELPRRSLEGAGDLDDVPSLGLSEDVFSSDDDVPAGYADYASEQPLASAADTATEPADAAIAEDATAPAEDAPAAEAEAEPEAPAAEDAPAPDPAPEAEAPAAETDAPAAEEAPAPDPAPEAEAPAAEAPAADEPPTEA